MKALDNKFLYNLIYNFYSDIKENRADVFENQLRALDNHTRSEQVDIWCDENGLPEVIADFLKLCDCDIQGILTEMLEEQNALDREATEEYFELRRTYQEVQGWK